MTLRPFLTIALLAYGETPGETDTYCQMASNPRHCSGLCPRVHAQKRNREQRIVRCSRSVPSPRVLRSLLQLLQDQVRSRAASHGACSGAGRNSGRIRVEVQYAIFCRAEAANAGLVENQGRRADAVGHVRGGRGHNDAYCIHRVTALTTSGDVIRQSGVKQASSRARRTARGAGLNAGARPSATSVAE